MNEFNARLKAITDRSDEERLAIWKRTEAVQNALAKQFANEMGLTALGYRVSCVNPDGTIIIYKINTCVEEFKMDFDKVMVEPSASEYSDYMCDGEFKGVRVRSWI